MIYLNARFSNQDLTGVQRVAYELGRRLLSRRSDMVAIAPTAPKPEYDIPVEVSPPVSTKLGGHFWEQTNLRSLAAKGNLLINLGGTGPVAVKRQIVMIYDVNYILGPDGYSQKFRMLYRNLQRHLAHRAEICTISDWSAQTIGAAFDVPAAKLKVIPLAADHLDSISADSETLKRYHLDQRPYFLCVGSANPNKNFATALAAYNLIDKPEFDLVIVGGGNAAIFQQKSESIANPNVHRLPRVTDAELKELMTRATGYLMPSLLEGYGLPAIEAMHLGTPAIVSRAAALPEVCGDAALYFDPMDAAALANTMCEINTNPALAGEMRERGLRHTKKFCWDQSADALERVIEQKLSGHS